MLDASTHRHRGLGGVGLTGGDGRSATVSKSVLVVDDEASIVDMLATLLLEEGFQVACAFDGEQAWGLVLRSSPDLVITDVSMPYLSGLDLMRRMRSIDASRRIPVILMSAADRRTTLDGASFVPKPFDLERMLSLVQRELAIA